MMLLLAAIFALPGASWAASCDMTVTVIDTAGQAVEGASIKLKLLDPPHHPRWLGTFTNGEAVLVPVGKDVAYTAEVDDDPNSPHTGTKHVDCTPLVIQSGLPGVAGLGCNFEVLADPGDQVQINGDPVLKGNGDPLSGQIGTSFLWRMVCGSITGPWHTKLVDCTNLDATKACCCMEIHAPAGVTVQLNGVPGTFEGVGHDRGRRHGPRPSKVNLPIGINILYRVTVSGITGNWINKNIDCTDLDIGEGISPSNQVCDMAILAPVGVTIQLNGVAGLFEGTEEDRRHGHGHGHDNNHHRPGHASRPPVVPLPMGNNILWRAMVNGITGPWITKHIDCTPLEVESGDGTGNDEQICEMDIIAPDNVAVQLNGVSGTFGDGDTVELPMGVNILWRASVNGITGPWVKKHVDCSALEIAQGTTVGGFDICDMSISAPPGVTVQLNGVTGGPFADGSQVQLPVGVNLLWRATINGITGPWVKKHIDCSALVISEGTTAGGFDICDMDISAPPGVTIQLNGVTGGPFADGSSVKLPVGVSLLWRATINGITGPWINKAIDCTPLVLTHGTGSEAICDMKIEALNGVTIQLNGVPGTFVNGNTVQLPNGVKILWRALVNGRWTGWQTKHVDCTALVAECPMKIVTPANSKVKIDWVGTFENGDVVPLKMGTSINWHGVSNNATGPGYTKLVDCTTLDASSAYCDMLINTPGTGKVKIDWVGTYENSNSVLLPVGIDVTWHAVANGVTGPPNTKPIDCTPLDTGPSEGEPYGAFCNMGIVAPAGGKVKIDWVGTYENGEHVLLPMGVDVTWHAVANGVTGPLYPKHVDCTDLSTLSPSAFCNMAIVAPSGGKVKIDWVGTYENGDAVLLPVGAAVTWRGVASGATSPIGHTKDVDCFPLDATSEFCNMEIDAENGVQVKIDWIGTYSDGQHVLLPIGAQLQWRALVNGQWTSYQTKNVDCTALVAQCMMQIIAPQSPDTDVPSKVVIHNVGYYSSGAVVPLKLGKTYQWSPIAVTQGHRQTQSPIRYSKLIDCTPLDATDMFCTFAVVNVPTDATVTINNVGVGYTEGNEVMLPVEQDVTWFLRLHGNGPNQPKHIDCNDLDVSDHTCQMQILTDPGTQVVIHSVGYFNNGDVLEVPIGAHLAWAGKANGKVGPNQPVKDVDCSPLDGRGLFCNMAISASNGNQAVIHGIGYYNDGDHVLFPIGSTISWSEKINGVVGPSTNKTIDCSALEVGGGGQQDPEICHMLIQAPAGVTVTIAGVGTFVNNEYADVTMMDDLAWTATNGKSNTKHVDCTALVVPGDIGDW